MAMLYGQHIPRSTRPDRLTNGSISKMVQMFVSGFGDQRIVSAVEIVVNFLCTLMSKSRTRACNSMRSCLLHT